MKHLINFILKKKPYMECILKFPIKNFKKILYCVPSIILRRKKCTYIYENIRKNPNNWVYTIKIILQYSLK